MTRTLTYAQVLCEATDLCLSHDPSVYVMGLGVPDPKGLFGSTAGLLEKHGPRRVRDMPTAENGMTGIALGSALVGMRPILTHQRMDFALLAMEQIVNQAAKWHYMFGGAARAPMVMRLIVGRGWGQGPQHAQSLQAWFAHVPGLRVVMPATAYDAKGMLIAAVEDDGPVVMIEHRWLYNLRSEVPEGIYRVPLDRARIARDGSDVTVAATSYMTVEALRAAERLATRGIHAEVVDLRSINPLDTQPLLASVKKTGRLVVADTGTTSFGIGAEVLARVSEAGFATLAAAPRRVASPDVPSPSAPSLSNAYFPRAFQIEQAVHEVLGLAAPAEPESGHPLDIPDPNFVGPF
jgi:pyruvate dehydrogenase E1 component beta subunit